MEESHTRAHVAELDLMRVVTALGVVGVHSGFLTLATQRSAVGHELQDAIVVALHFTRAVFMFMTAFALTYVYKRSDLKVLPFYRKRGIGVLLPYVVWSIIYQWQMTPWTFDTLGNFLHTAIYNLITGRAEMQLYFILLTIQFYALFPLFLWLVKATQRRHGWLLAVSGMLQLAIYVFVAMWVQNHHLTGWFWDRVWRYDDRPVFTYPFFFALGGVAAWHVTAVRAWLLAHGRLISIGGLLGLAGMLSVYSFQTLVMRLNEDEVTGVLQPVMLIYSPLIIVCLGWLAVRWARCGAASDGRPRGYPLWHLLADATFGIYLTHMLFVRYFIKHLIPALPIPMRPLLAFPLIWLVSAAAAIGLSIALMSMPGLSRLVGRHAPNAPLAVSWRTWHLQPIERPGLESKQPI